jgi:hypothetical protein
MTMGADGCGDLGRFAIDLTTTFDRALVFSDGTFLRERRAASLLVKAARHFALAKIKEAVLTLTGA